MTVADTVVVELQARVDGYVRNLKQAERQSTATAKAQEDAAAKAATAVTRQAQAQLAALRASGTATKEQLAAAQATVVQARAAEQAARAELALAAANRAQGAAAFQAAQGNTTAATAVTRKGTASASAASAASTNAAAMKAETAASQAVTGAFRNLSATLATFGVGLGLMSLGRMASEWSDLNSRVINTTGSVNAGRQALERLTQVARRTYSPLQQTAEAFLQNSISLQEMGYNLQQQLDLTEALNNSLVISATRGDRARVVMEAWSRAMALGELRGQNLNTIIQNGGRLTQALADSMGVSTNQLRRLGAEGKITSREMFGVTSQLADLRREADEMPATLEDGFVLLGNAAIQLVGSMDQATGVSGALADELVKLADGIEESARRWRDGDVPILHFIQSLVDIADQLGLVSEELEDTRSDIELIEAPVDAARAAFAELAEEILSMSVLSAINPDLPGEVEDVTSALEEGTIGAEEARVALLALGEANPDLRPAMSMLAALAGQLREVRNEADEAYAALNAPSGPARPRGELGTRRRQTAAANELTQAFVTEQERLASLTRDQLALEREIQKVREEAAEQGVRLTSQEAERLAQLRILSADRRKEANSDKGPDPQRFADALDQQRRQIDMLREETAVRAGLNPLINDYGYALERLRIQQDLENEATRAGLALTPDRVAAISMLAEEYANASVEAARLTEQQQGLKDTVEEWAGVMQQATRGFIDDLIEGKDAAEAFGNVLRNIGNQLINMGLGSLFSSSNVGGLFNFGGPRARGGPVSSGRSYLVGERGPELFTPSSAGHITANDQMGGGGVTVQMANDFRGVDPASVARIEAGLDKLAANIVPTIRREIAVGPKKGRR